MLSRVVNGVPRVVANRPITGATASVNPAPNRLTKAEISCGRRDVGRRRGGQALATAFFLASQRSRQLCQSTISEPAM
jgi:hypothetical protein